MSKEGEPLEYIQRAFDFDEAELAEDVRLRRLREGLAPYVDIPKLRQLVAEHRDLNAALRSDAPPAQVLVLIETLTALLYPPAHEQIRSPSDAAALLMVQMGHLD